jgi:hypothetical protein
MNNAKYNAYDNYFKLHGKEQYVMDSKLTRFVDKLIRANAQQNDWEYGLSIHNLPESVKQQFAALLFEEDDRDLYSIYENPRYDEVMSYLIVMLKEDTLDSRQDFAQSFKTQMVRYYEKKMASLIEERLPIVSSDDQGYFKDAFTFTKDGHQYI